MKPNILLSKKFLVLSLLFIVIAAGVAMWIFSRPPALRVISTSVSNGEIQNPYEPVTVFFNRVPKNSEPAITIVPSVGVHFAPGTNGSVEIIPNDTFQAFTLYTVTVSTSPPYEFTFTAGQTVSNTPGWGESFTREYNIYLQQHGVQDAALQDIRLHAPESGQGFTVNYSYANNTYVVMLSQPYDQTKTNFLAWINQRGVTDLSTVRIIYINK